MPIQQYANPRIVTTQIMPSSYARFNEGIYIIPQGVTMGINVAMAVNVSALVKLFYTEV